MPGTIDQNVLTYYFQICHDKICWYASDKPHSTVFNGNLWTFKILLPNISQELSAVVPVKISNLPGNLY